MSTLVVYRSVYHRTWLKVARRPVILLLSFVQPLIWMSFFGFLFQRFDLGALPANVSYLDFLVPGICGMTVLVGGSQSGIGLIRDMQAGMLERTLCTPASRWGMLTGKISADVSRLLIQAVVVAALGFLLGARYHINLRSLIASLACLSLFGAGYCGISCWIALKTRRQESMASFIHLTNMPLFFTSSALVPAKKMPAWLANLADWNPLSLALEQLRGGLVYGTTPAALPAFVVLTALCIVALAAAYTELDRYLVAKESTRV